MAAETVETYNHTPHSRSIFSPPPPDEKIHNTAVPMTHKKTGITIVPITSKLPKK